MHRRGEVLRARRWLAIMVGGGLLLAACGGGQHNASSGSSQRGTGACAPGTCGVSVSTTTSTATSAGTRGSSLQAWSSAHLAAFRALSAEATQLGRGSSSVSQFQAGCSKLGSHVQAAMAIQLPPDPAAAAHVRAGLTQLQQFAHDCSAAFKGDTAAGSRMLLEETRGASEIDQAIQAVEAAGGSSP